jgi:hypothetical protein
MPWFSALVFRGAVVLVGDPGRAYLPSSGLRRLATYAVPVTRARGCRGQEDLGMERSAADLTPLRNWFDINFLQRGTP